MSSPLGGLYVPLLRGVRPRRVEDGGTIVETIGEDALDGVERRDLRPILMLLCLLLLCCCCCLLV